MDMQNVAKLEIPEGEVRTIHDKNGDLLWGKVSYSVKYEGDTAQNGTPTPDAPVAVQTVTGENAVMINGKNLWPINSSIPRYNCSITPDGDSLIIVASGGTNSNIYPSFELDANTQYTFSGSFKITNFVGPAPIGAVIQGYNGSSWIVIKDERATISDTSSHDFAVSFNSGSYKSIRVGFGINVYNTSAANTVVLSNPQLEKGQTATEYEPYQGQSYPISLGSIELCKIGTYKDYIYKSSGKWYVHKEVGKQLVDTSTILLQSNYSNVEYARISEPSDFIGYNKYQNHALICSSAVYQDGGDSTFWNNAANIGHIYTRAENVRFWMGFTKGTGLDAIKTALAGCIIYYPLATPTDTEITNAALVAQLEAVEQWLARYGYNATVSGNLPIIIDRTAL